MLSYDVGLAVVSVSSWVLDEECVSLHPMCDRGDLGSGYDLAMIVLGETWAEIKTPTSQYAIMLQSSKPKDWSFWISPMP